jgi:uncharacterized protein DUF4430
MLVALAAALVAAGAAGCGLGAGTGTSDVRVTVSQDFGTRPLAARTVAKVPGSETVMRMLQRAFRVTTRYGGGFVQSISGHSGDGARHDWFYYVNGIEAEAGAAATKVHRGDRIWWDLHDWRATESIPAVVGSFPEPFVHGIGGKRYPTTIECGAGVQAACGQVGKALTQVGIPAATQQFGTGSGVDSLGVVVATWSTLRAALVSSLVDRGPGTSGVYARFNRAGTRLELLNPAGQVVRTLGPGAGLVAATAAPNATPTWLVTGTDPAGVAAAAAALTPAALDGRFALAVSGQTRLALPLEAGQ